MYHLCGGTIFNPEWIITAAHCTPKAGQTVAAGQLNSYTVEFSDQYAKVVDVFVHPIFNATSWAGNIALLRVEPPFKVIQGQLESVPKLQTQGQTVLEGVSCRVSGFGTSTGGLSTGTVVVNSDEDCDAVYQEIYPGLGIFETYEFCAGDADSDFCFGDDGGPLVCHGDTLSGIAGPVGTSQACGSRPGIYTDVGQFSDWLAPKSHLKVHFNR